MRENPEEQAWRRTYLSGKNSPLWKGIDSILAAAYRGEGWLLLTERIRKRAKYCCKRCGISESELGRKLDVHHIEPWFNFTDSRQANKIANLQALCQSCHRLVEKRTNVQLCLPYTQGKHGRRFGTMHPSAQFSSEQIRAIRKLSQAGESSRSIAKGFNTTHSIILSIVHYRTYRDVP